jgi:hypothetical protein
MVTWQPAEKVRGENEIANDVAEATMQLLPMRCIIDQRSISFIRAFFGSDEEGDKKEDWMTGLHVVPPPRFRIFRVKQWTVKVDYIPKTIDFSALREGSFVELVNLNPIDGMVITLQQVNAKNEIGFGAVFGSLVRSWVQDVCATQVRTVEHLASVPKVKLSARLTSFSRFCIVRSFISFLLMHGHSNLSSALVVVWPTFSFSPTKHSNMARTFHVHCGLVYRPSLELLRLKR